MKEKGQGRPEGAPNSQRKSNQPEQSPDGGSIKSPERWLLPNVWDILERRAKVYTPDPNRSFGERWDQKNEVNRLMDGLSEQGTSRDRLTINLYRSITTQPGVGERYVRELLLEEFQQFRSKVERLSEGELAEEIRKEEEEKQRKIEESRKTSRPLTLDPPKEIPYKPPWHLGAF